MPASGQYNIGHKVGIIPVLAVSESAVAILVPV
jgi:hypothetical protein